MTLGKKTLISLGLLAIIVLDLALLLSVYVKFEAPIGWDTPTYINLIKTLSEKGVRTFLVEHYYPHLYSFFEYSINELLIHDPFLIEKILPIALNIVLVLFLAFAVHKTFRNYKLSVLSAFFAATSTNLIRVTADLHRNMLGCIFLISTLLLALELHKKFSLKRYLILLIPWTLLIATHFETAAFLMLVVLVYECLILKSWKFGCKKLLLRLSWVFIPPMLFVLLFYPHSLRYVSVLYVQVLEKQTRALGVTMTFGDIPYYLQLLGGVNIPFVILGLFGSIKLAKKEVPHGLLVTCSLTALIVGVLFWGFMDRSFLLFPNSVLGALGVLLVYRRLARFETNALVAKHYIIKHKKGLAGMIILLIVIALNIFNANISVAQWLHPSIEDETYRNLRWLSTQVKEPLIVMAKWESPWAGGALEIYRNWVEATIGSNYVYVGKLYTLLHGYRTTFNHQELEKFSIETWNELVRDDILENLDQHPVVILKEFYYSHLTPYEMELVEEVRKGVYMLRHPTEELYSVRLVPYLDFYVGSNNWYEANMDWATTGSVLMVCNENPEEVFYVSYKILLLSNISYLIKLRLYDASSDFAPVILIFDKEVLSEVTYNGTENAIEMRVPLGEVNEGFHEFTLRISDLTRPHMLALDYIDFIPNWNQT